MFVNIKVQRSVFSVYFKPLTVLPEGYYYKIEKIKQKYARIQDIAQI